MTSAVDQQLSAATGVVRDADLDTWEEARSAAARYDRWCAVNSFPTGPGNADLVLAYLHTEGSHWRPSTVKSQLGYLRRVHAEAGAPLTDVRLKLYQRWRNKTWTGPVGDDVATLTSDQVAEMATALAEPAWTLDHCRVQATLTLADRLHVPVLGRGGIVTSLHRSAFEVDDRGVQVRRGDAYTLVAVDDPLHGDLIAVLAAGTDHPLDPDCTNLWQRICKAAHVDLADFRDPKRLSRVSDAQRRLLVDVVEPHRLRRLRRLARLLVAFEHAARHADLQHILLEEARSIDEGFILRLERDKTHRDRRPSRCFVALHNGGDSPCNTMCSGCAVADLLDYLRIIGTTQGPVFGHLYGARWRYPSRQGARMDLLAVARMAGLTLRLATKSLRRGGAVDKLEAGYSLEEVQALLGHSSVFITLTYLAAASPVLLVMHRRR